MRLLLLTLLAGFACAETVTCKGVTFDLPDGWEVLEPTSRMRALEIRLGGEEEEDAPVLVVYYFGPDGAGSREANVARWLSQLTQPDGRDTAEVAEKEESEVGGFTLFRLSATGTFVAPMMPGAPEAHNEEGYGLRCAILDGPEGPLYFKLVGPEETLAAQDEALDKLLGSVERALRID